MNAWAAPSCPLSDRYALPSASVTTVAETPLPAALIALATSSRLVPCAKLRVAGLASVMLPSLAAVPTDRVSVPVKVAAVRLAKACPSAVRALCAAASRVTPIERDSPLSAAPGKAVAVSTFAFELCGWVVTVPLVASDCSAEAKPVMVLLSVATPEIWVVSVDACVVSASVRAANSAFTRLVTSVEVSTPEPVLSDDSSCCVAVVIAPVVVLVELVVVMQAPARSKG